MLRDGGGTENSKKEIKEEKKDTEVIHGVYHSKTWFARSAEKRKGPGVDSRACAGADVYFRSLTYTCGVHDQHMPLAALPYTREEKKKRSDSCIDSHLQ